MVLVKTLRYAPGGNKAKIGYFTVTVTVKVTRSLVTRSLTLVTFAGVLFVSMHAKYEVSISYGSIDQMTEVKVFCRKDGQTDRTKTRCPRIPFRGHNKIIGQGCDMVPIKRICGKDLACKNRNASLSLSNKTCVCETRMPLAATKSNYGKNL